MTHNNYKSIDSRSHAIDSCTYQFNSWRPFHLQTLDSSDPPPKPSSTKRPCLSDRATSSFSIDLSKLSLFDDDTTAKPIYPRGSSLRLRIGKRRRRRGSRSVSGRSSDRSRRCGSVASAAHGTCSDFLVAVATDSSGEFFGNGDVYNWASDVSEAKNSGRKEREEKEGGLGLSGSGGGQFGNFDGQGNESGYGSEPGYRGDAEFGYGDEIDEDEEDGRVLFWGDQFGDTDTKMEMVGENTFSDQKSHHRCRRKKHDGSRMVD